MPEYVPNIEKMMGHGSARTDPWPMWPWPMTHRPIATLMCGRHRRLDVPTAVITNKTSSSLSKHLNQAFRFTFFTHLQHLTWMFLFSVTPCIMLGLVGAVRLVCSHRPSSTDCCCRWTHCHWRCSDTQLQPLRSSVVRLSVPCSVPCRVYFFRFAMQNTQRMSTQFAGLETNTVNDHIHVLSWNRNKLRKKFISRRCQTGADA